ncbi:MAG: TIGR03617 family F420-dependent LLM class oxidoreductase [Anaerolineales bacterium]|nr:TIGR03617 family F420-dependent LLM class oxidoreductase [Anaerolineales bacterium]
MKVDASLPPVSLTAIPAIVRAAEMMGFDAIWSTETMHDPFLPGALIAEHTQKLCFGTAVAIAFARSPATLAYTAWDLAQASQGRFILGLGTQVKAHVERRFGMPWPDSVVAKLHEQIEAMRAFWHTWQTGAALNVRGEYYKLNLMSPFFNPGPIPNPDIPIFIAGVNTGLARLAGEVADGFLVHPLHTPRYLREVLLPAIEEGLSRSGRSRDKFQVANTVFVVTSPEEDFFVRSQIAFYASTPSYRAVMALHGWEQTAEKLSTLAAHKQWAEMPALISDEMLSSFALVASAEDLPERISACYQDLVDRISLYLPFVPGERDDFWKVVVKGLQGTG